MPTTAPNTAPTEPSTGEETLSLASMFDVVHRWRRTVALFVVTVCVLTVVALILTPNRFTSRANVRPESGQEVLGGLQAVLSAQLGPMGSKFGKGEASPLDDFVILLESHGLAGEVVDELGLVEVYDIDEEDPRVAREVAIKELRKNTATKITDQFTISFAATDRDAERSTAIVNTYLDALGEANHRFSTTRASGLRAFLEERLTTAELELNASLDSLQAFQIVHGTPDMIEQSKVTVGVIGQLQGELVALETKREALSAFRTGDHTQIRQLDANISALKSRVNTMSGAVDTAPGVPPDPGALLALGAVPELARQHALLLLDVEVRKNVYGLLTSQYEQARIDEAKNTATVRVLDPPVVPIEKSSPKRTLTLIAAAIGATLFALVMVAIFDRLVDPALRTERGRRKALNKRMRSEWVRWVH